MSPLKNLTLFLFLIFLIKKVNSANILYVGAIASPSHYIWNKALALGLVAKGHNVTLISPDKDKNPEKLPANYSRIVLDGVYEAIHGTEDDSYNEWAKLTPYESIQVFNDWCILNCKLNLASNGTKQILNYPDNFKFDAIIYDVTTPSCLIPLMKKFNYPPIIGVSAFLLPTYLSFDFGNFLVPSIIPWYALPYSNQMTLIERFWNFLLTYYDVYNWQKIYKETHELSKKIFGQNIPKYSEFQKKISLLIANSDPMLDYPQTVPPNIILVGGLHARKANKLPEDLQNVLDNAKDGAIVFSLGTNIRSDQLGKENIKAFLEAFSKLKQTVLWKFESEIDNLPKNVIVRKWLPQNDLLAHPNVRLFIGHGGALSTQESIFHGVPMALLPFFVDQYINTRNIVEKKLGIKLDINLLNSEYILEKLKKILNNKLYSENVKKTMKLFKDRQETPLERAVFWVEYVIRNGGAEHLNLPVRDMPFYKALNIDVGFILILIVVVSLLIVYSIVKNVCKFVFKSNDAKIKVN